MQCLLNHRTNFDKRNKFMVHKIKLSKVIHYRTYIYKKYPNGNRGDNCGSALQRCDRRLMSNVIYRYEDFCTYQDDNEPLEEVRFPILENLLKKSDIVLQSPIKIINQDNLHHNTNDKLDERAFKKQYLYEFQFEIKACESLS